MRANLKAGSHISKLSKIRIKLQMQRLRLGRRRNKGICLVHFPVSQLRQKRTKHQVCLFYHPPCIRHPAGHQVCFLPIPPLSACLPCLSSVLRRFFECLAGPAGPAAEGSTEGENRRTPEEVWAAENPRTALKQAQERVQLLGNELK